jgi:SAM-dependent methyltransferase
MLWKLRAAYDLFKDVQGTFWPTARLGRISSLEEYLAPYSAHSLQLSNSTTLDIGCGDAPRNPFSARTASGIDIRDDLGANIRSADLAVEPIPFGDESFDYVTAFDFLEHIPRVVYAPKSRFAFVELMNEIWRVLKPNGIFLSQTPIYPYTAAFQDPTHVNIMTADTFPKYFDTRYKWAGKYGFRGGFQIVDQSMSAPWLNSLLRKA